MQRQWTAWIVESYSLYDDYIDELAPLNASPTENKNLSKNQQFNHNWSAIFTRTRKVAKKAHCGTQL